MATDFEKSVDKYADSIKFICPKEIAPENANKAYNNLRANKPEKSSNKNKNDTSSSGIDSLSPGFYSDKKPNVQIIVNGEIIINSQNNNNLNKNIYMSNKKNGGINYSGSITGLSLIEFIMLPKQSKLSVCYNGGNGMGFIGLKKL